MSHSTAAPAPTKGAKVLKFLVTATAFAVAAYVIWNSYEYMVLFSERRLELDRASAQELGGVIEVSLAFFGLAAYYQASRGRPHGQLLIIAWVLGGLTGVLVAGDQYLEHGFLAAAARLIVPLVGVLLLHVALLLQRDDVAELLAGKGWREIRDELRARLEERRRDNLVVALAAAMERTRDAVRTERGDRMVRRLERRETVAYLRAARRMDAGELSDRLGRWIATSEARDAIRGRFFVLGRRPSTDAESVSADTPTLSATGHDEVPANALDAVRGQLALPASTSSPVSADRAADTADTVREPLSADSTGSRADSVRDHTEVTAGTTADSAGDDDVLSADSTEAVRDEAPLTSAGNGSGNTADTVRGQSAPSAGTRRRRRASSTRNRVDARTEAEIVRLGHAGYSSRQIADMDLGVGKTKAAQILKDHGVKTPPHGIRQVPADTAAPQRGQVSADSIADTASGHPELSAITSSPVSADRAADSADSIADTRGRPSADSADSVRDDDALSADTRPDSARGQSADTDPTGTPAAPSTTTRN